MKKYSVLCFGSPTDIANIISVEVSAETSDKAKHLAVELLRKAGYPNAIVAPDLRNPAAPVVMELESQQHPIVSYLEEKGLNCSQKGNQFIVTTNGTSLANIQVILSSEQNFLGGYNYRATFTTMIDIDFNKKDKLISDIKEKCCDIGNISIADNSCKLTLTADLTTIDNKNPGAYCYNMLLKGFIENIDESSVIWKAYEEENEPAKKRYEEYLIAHAGEIEMLQARKKELERQIAEIKAQNERIKHDALNVPAAQEYAEKQKECSMVEQELRGLWVFAFKRKKELHQKLEKLYQEKAVLYNKEQEQRKAVLATQDTSAPIKKKEIREIEKSLEGIHQQAEAAKENSTDKAPSQKQPAKTEYTQDG